MTSLGSKHSPACTTTDVMRPWLDDEGDSDEEQEEVLLMKSMQRVRLEDEKGIDAGFVGKVRLSFQAQLVGRVALTLLLHPSAVVELQPVALCARL